MCIGTSIRDSPSLHPIELVDLVAVHHLVEHGFGHRIRAIEKGMQGIHVMHRNFEHDFAVVRSHRSDGLGQIQFSSAPQCLPPIA